MTNSNKNYMRGGIYFVNGGNAVGGEHWGDRPGVIVSNAACNKFSPVVEMVFFTTVKKKHLPTHVEVNSTKRPSLALCEQIVSVDKSRLGRYYGNCTQQEMKAIDQALLVSLGLTLTDPRLFGK